MQVEGQSLFNSHKWNNQTIGSKRKSKEIKIFHGCFTINNLDNKMPKDKEIHFPEEVTL